MYESIDEKKIWDKIFPPRCFRNFWNVPCLTHLRVNHVLNSWEIFALCPHARECASTHGYSFEDIKRNLDQVERNRIVNLKVAKRRVKS